MNEDLVDRLRRDDRHALDQLFREAARDVYRLALKIGRNRELAEDVTQDAFIRIWETRHRLDPGRSVRGLLTKITVNLCLDRLRQASRHRTSDFDDEAEMETLIASGPIGSAETRSLDRLAVDQALGRLPVIYRTVLALRYGQDLSYQEIADAIEISVQAVALRIHRAKQLLRGRLEADSEKETSS